MEGLCKKSEFPVQNASTDDLGTDPSIYKNKSPYAAGIPLLQSRYGHCGLITHMHHRRCCVTTNDNIEEYHDSHIRYYRLRALAENRQILIENL